LENSRETLLNCLNEVAEIVLNSEKQFGLVYDVPLANELADTLLQTIFLIIARSLSSNSSIWKKFRATLSKATRWSQAVTHWKSTLSEITKLLSKEIYLVEVEHMTTSKSFFIFIFSFLSWTHCNPILQTKQTKETKRRPRAHSQSNETETGREELSRGSSPDARKGSSRFVLIFLSFFFSFLFSC